MSWNSWVKTLAASVFIQCSLCVYFTQCFIELICTLWQIYTPTLETVDLYTYMYNFFHRYTHKDWFTSLPPANEVWGKVMLYTGLSFCSRGEGDLPTPGCRHPSPDADNPWMQTPWMHPLGCRPPPPRFLLECLLMRIIFASDFWDENWRVHFHPVWLNS